MLCGQGKKFENVTMGTCDGHLSLFVNDQSTKMQKKKNVFCEILCFFLFLQIISQMSAA